MTAAGLIIDRIIRGMSWSQIANSTESSITQALGDGTFQKVKPLLESLAAMHEEQLEGTYIKDSS